MENVYSEGKLIDLVFLVSSTTWYTLNSVFDEHTDDIAMEGAAFLSTVEFLWKKMEYREYNYKLLGMVCWWGLIYDQRNTFVSNLHHNIKFTLEEKSNGELELFSTLSKHINENTSIVLCRKPTHADKSYPLQSSHRVLRGLRANSRP